MKQILLAISISIFTSFASASNCSEMVFRGAFPKTSEPVEILCKKRFVIGYSTTRKAPLWVAEVLTINNVTHDKVSRQNKFRPDPALPNNRQASLDEYIGTDYDRGHMVSFEDVADDPEASSESFFMTNMIPQIAANNRGIWKALEGRVRKLSLEKKIIYIVTGPIFDDNNRLSRGASIPTRLYKMVLSPSTSESYTLVIPNIALPTSTMPQYFTTISNLRIMNPLVEPLPTNGTFIDKRSFK